MSYDQIYSLAIQGMSLEKLRVDTVANNIAHQHSLLDKTGQGFKPMEVVASVKPFSGYLQDLEIALRPQNLPPSKVYQPSHPLADKQGYLRYPGINMVTEMTTLLRASHAYEANIKLMNTAHSMFLQSLSIGEER